MARLTLLAFLIAVGPAAAQTVPPGYEVARWQGFRDAALSYTFDDGTSAHLSVVVPLFDELGFRATFFTVTGWSPNWSGLAEAAENGHEVASHTVSHPDLTTIGGSAQLTELRDSHDAIASNVPASGSQTLAYPYCVKGSDIATRLYYFAARGCQGAVESATPADFLNISSMIVGTEGGLRTADHLDTRIASAQASGGWAVFLIHGVDGDGGWSPVPSAELRAHLEYVRENDSVFWVETFGNVVRYIRERNAAVVTEISASADAVRLSLSDNLDDATYDHPLTVRRELPDDWPGATVSQNGSAVASRIERSSAGATVIFDVVPDAGEITLARSDATGIGSRYLPDRSSVIDSFPNPADGQITVGYRVRRDAHVTIEVFDLLGRRVSTLVREYLPAGRYRHVWETDGIPPGQYVVRLSAASDVDTGVLVVI